MWTYSLKSCMIVFGTERVEPFNSTSINCSYINLVTSSFINRKIDNMYSHAIASEAYSIRSTQPYASGNASLGGSVCPSVKRLLLSESIGSYSFTTLRISHIPFSTSSLHCLNFNSIEISSFM